MLKVLLYILSITLFLFSSFDVSANNIKQPLTTKSAVVEYFNNDNKKYSIEQIQQLKPTQWLSEKNFKHKKLTNNHYWLHIRVKINSNTTDSLFLEVANPLLDKINVYLFRGQQSRNYTTENSKGINRHPIVTPALYFPLPSNESPFLDIYLEYQDETASQLSLAITDHKESFENTSSHGIFIGMIVGTISVLLLVTLVLYREKKSLLLQYYFGLLILGSISILSLEGATLSYFWSHFLWLQKLLIPSLLLFTLCSSIILTKELISNKVTDYPLIENILKWIPRLIIVISLSLLILPSVMASIISIVILCISIISISGALIVFTIKSRIIQTWLLVAWFAFTISLTLKAIYFSGVISIPPVLISIATVFYCLQFLLWGSIILHRYIYRKTSQCEKSNQLIDELQTKNQEVNDSLIQHHQEHLDLEAVINERTFELNVTLRELQETNLQLEEQATNDALTGVKNRKFFDQRLEAEYRLSRRQHTPVALLLLDADKFKLINDNYGHLAGDKVLIEISNVASRMFKRPNDYVCRYGGEEFAILLSHTDEKGALKVAQSIRQKIEDTTIKTHNESLQVTVSIGVSVLMIDKSTPETLLFEQADKALYFAKESGRNNVKSYNEFQLSNK